MPTKGRPPNRGGSNKPSNRGAHTPKPQPQPVRGRGTTHGGKNKRGAGAGQTRPPSKDGCPKQLIAVPATIIKLLCGWRPEGYKVAQI